MAQIISEIQKICCDIRANMQVNSGAINKLEQSIQLFLEEQNFDGLDWLRLVELLKEFTLGLQLCVRRSKSLPEDQQVQVFTPSLANVAGYLAELSRIYLVQNRSRTQSDV